MLPNSNRPPNMPLAPSGLILQPGYMVPQLNQQPQMTRMVYPMVPGQQQLFLGSVPNPQYFQHQSAYMQQAVPQPGRPRTVPGAKGPPPKSSEFTAQQQKLKAFGMKGVKAPSVSMDGFIESMFGKTPHKVEKKTHNISQPASIPVPTVSQEVQQPVTSPVPAMSPPIKKQAPVKSLEAMMQECTNISANEPKPIRRKPSSAGSDQKRAQHSVPQQPLPRFPVWCCRESAPPLYLEVENIVTVDSPTAGVKMIDNSRLLPLLMSSGLPKELLAYIWEAVSLTQPGTLSQQELYAALALVGLCQAGYHVSGPEVLRMLGTPPIPSLLLPQPPLEEMAVAASSNTPTPPSNPEFPGTTTSNEDDEFNDFKQAAFVEPHQQPVSHELPPQQSLPHSAVTTAAPAINSAAVSQNDKYAVFLELEPKPEISETALVENTVDDFGDFLSADFGVISFPTPPASLTNMASTPINVTDQDHAFDQLHSTFFSATLPKQFQADFAGFGASIFGTEDTAVTQPPFHENFADFESQGQEAFAVSPTNEDSPDDEFGRFAQSGLLPMVDTRLAETQSVASLELASGGERLSRHGSSLSLDSKDAPGGQPSLLPEESVKHHQRSVSDGQALVVKALTPGILEPSESSVSSVSLVDRYSSIRNERVKVGGSCIHDLGRCLQSCLRVLEACVCAFKQMSSTDVFHEVLAAKEALDYIKNVKEVFTVSQRIRAAALAAGSPVELQGTLKSIQETWDSLVQIIGTPHHPSVPFDLGSPSLKFSSAVLSTTDTSRSCCGVCLLDVDDPHSTCWTNSNSAQVKLSYGRRQYHATCANLWLNCVDPILPALTLSELYTR